MENKDEDRVLVRTQMTTAPDIASLVDPGNPETYAETMRCQPTASQVFKPGRPREDWRNRKWHAISLSIGTT